MILWNSTAHEMAKVIDWLIANKPLLNTSKKIIITNKRVNTYLFQINPNGNRIGRDLSYNVLVPYVEKAL